MTEEEYRHYQEVRAQLRQLFEHPGWKWLRQVMENQVGTRIGTLVLTAPEGLDDMVRKAYATGEVAGLKLAMDLPQASLDTIDEDLEQETARRNAIVEEDRNA